MSIEQIRKDALENRKACMNKKLDAVTMEKLQIERKLYSSIVGEFKKIEVDERREPTDEDAKVIVRNYVKNGRDNLINYSKANNSEKVNEVNIELEALAKYMPKQLNSDELKVVIEKFISENEVVRAPASIKIVMKYLNDNYKDAFNPKEASALVSSALKP